LSVSGRRIEVHKREIVALRLRLQNRQQLLFEQVVKAIESRDDNRASVYAVELSEVKKVLRVVTASELALTQIVVRLESIRDVGDVFTKMNEAFKVMRNISKSVSGVVPALEDTTNEVNTTLSETLLDLGKLSPSISIDPRTEGDQEIFEKAKLFSEEKAMDLADAFSSSLFSSPDKILNNKSQKVALFADGGISDESEFKESEFKEPEFKATVLSKPNERSSTTQKVLEYVKKNGGGLNVIEASKELNMSVDDVEEAAYSLVAKGKLKRGTSSRGR
jgi:hypothetical protein